MYHLKNVITTNEQFLKDQRQMHSILYGSETQTIDIQLVVPKSYSTAINQRVQSGSFKSKVEYIKKLIDNDLQNTHS